MKTIDQNELRDLVSSDPSMLLLDVLPPEYFDRAHLPKAKNACVYEVDFLDQVQRLQPEKQSAVVVYGSGAPSLASETAARKLEAAGYTNILEFKGGVAEWKKANLPLEGAGPVKPPKLASSFLIDPVQSHLEWTGRNIASIHRGTIKLLNGAIHLRGTELESGVFTIDMTSIKNDDIPEGTLRDTLVKHLLSEDFFEAKKFPVATFRFLEARRIEGASEGETNFTVRGELEIKAVTNTIEFSAVIMQKDDGQLAAEAHFDLDRTRWNVLYGSAKFFDKLGKHLVHDNVSIGLKIVAVPQS
jgi:polyisoprenoid-binding protein YceI